MGWYDVSFKLNWFLVTGANLLSGRQISRAANFFSGQSSCLHTISRHGKLTADGSTLSCLCFLPTLAWWCVLLFASSMRGSHTDFKLLKSWNIQLKTFSVFFRYKSQVIFLSLTGHSVCMVIFLFFFLRNHVVENVITGATPQDCLFFVKRARPS